MANHLLSLGIKKPRPISDQGRGKNPAVPPLFSVAKQQLRSAKVVFNLPSLITGDEPGRHYYTTRAVRVSAQEWYSAGVLARGSHRPALAGPPWPAYWSPSTPV